MVARRIRSGLPGSGLIRAIVRRATVHPGNRPPGAASPTTGCRAGRRRVPAGTTLVLVRDPAGVWHYATLDANRRRRKPLPPGSIEHPVTVRRVLVHRPVVVRCRASYTMPPTAAPRAVEAPPGSSGSARRPPGLAGAYVRRQGRKFELPDGLRPLASPWGRWGPIRANAGQFTGLPAKSGRSRKPRRGAGGSERRGDKVLHENRGSTRRGTQGWPFCFG